MKQANLEGILRLPGTVFSFAELLLSFAIDKPKNLARRLNHYTSKGQLYSPRRRFYAKDKNYDPRELATKIYTPAYISLEIILVEHGIVFQYYERIFVVTYQTKEITCDGKNFEFKAMRRSLLVDAAGIENRGTYYAATKERAFLDVLYYNKNYHFDNLRPLDYDKVLALLPIYNNKRMTRVVMQQFRDFHNRE